MKPPDNLAIPIAHHIHAEIHSQGELRTLKKYWGDMTREEIEERCKVLCERFYNEYLGA
jgi:hypothetical protein